jgi:hypothetical protein
VDALKNLLENLKERIKVAWAEQQETELYISTKEKFEALPIITQKLIIAGAGLLLVLLFLWWPVSNLIDSMDFNGQFNEQRQVLKELFRIDRDMSSGPNVPTPPTPVSLKSTFDSKIAASGIKSDQIKDQSEMPPQNVGGADQKGYQYHIAHLTIRQAIDLSYELEHADPSLKLGGLELIAEAQDPHFYEVGIKLVTFAPKVASLGTPGKGIVDAIKKSRDKEDKNAE